ncbi:M20/M25/M40 family metallo-hydrolase [Streptomyces sp. NPDC048751]|uniref:M20/M25/M40 family metallo-hydrolase n=1 Tax=Streptomyces sp. NPDC048751 TaxID=3365591 RepID=UPI00371D5C12
MALRLHAEPEYALAEQRAAALLAGEPAQAGFEVDRPVAGLPTAFTACYGRGRSAVALLLEYDALPGLGHACGHNLIAAAGLGAALAACGVLDDSPGSVMAVGTVAEEGGGGKAVEVEAGVFDDVDATLMFHPGGYDWQWAPLTAQVQYRVSFHGRAAHPTGDPASGIDALAVLGRRLSEASHVQGIVTHGGTATHIVPEHAQGLFGLQGGHTAALDDLVGQLRDRAEDVARATGTRVERVRATRAGP